jgi:hypothetical protein
MTMSTAETSAIRTDARARLLELEAVKKAIIDDRDDPLVMSELTSIQSAIDACEQALS